MTTILYYLPCFFIGGTELQAVQLVSGLDSRHFRAVVWSSGPPGPVAHILRRAGVSALYSPLHEATLQQTAAWILDLGATIFHSFGYLPNCLDVVCARLANIPWIITSRRNGRHWDRSQRLQLWEKVRNRWTDLVIANCQAVASVCSQVEGIDPDRLRVVYNGVALPEENGAAGQIRRRLGLGKADLLLGNVANLRPIKNQALLLKAFRLVARRLSNVHLAILGEGPERSNLEDLRQKLGLQDRVSFMGLRADAHQIYGAMDLYVQSSASEGLPNSVLEAMSHGVPVVATAVGGTPEAVVSGATGLVVRPGSPQALAEAMLRVLTDQRVRREMGARGRQRVVECFLLSRMVRDYENIYAALAQRPESGPSARRPQIPRPPVAAARV